MSKFSALFRRSSQQNHEKGSISLYFTNSIDEIAFKQFGLSPNATVADVIETACIELGLERFHSLFALKVF